MCGRHISREPDDLKTLMPAFLAAQAWARSALSSFVLRASGIFSKHPDSSPFLHFTTDATCSNACNRVRNVRVAHCASVIFFDVVGTYLP